VRASWTIPPQPPRGVRTLLGGLALCPCGTVSPACRPYGASHLPVHSGHPHRLTRVGMWRGRPGRWRSHRQTRGGQAVSPDAADLVTVQDSGVDVAACGRRPGGIRVNLEEMPATGAGARSPAPRCSRPPRPGTTGWRRIGAELGGAARRTCWPRGGRRERRPPCGRAWISAASARSQDADDGDAALAGPRCPRCSTRLRSRSPGSSPAPR